MVDHARAVVSANAAKRARAVSATAAPAAPDASSTALTVAEDRIDVAELLMWAGEDGSDPGTDGDAAALTAGGGGAAGGAAAGLSAGVPARAEDESPDTLRMRRLQMSDHVTRGGATLLEVVPPSGAKGKNVAPIAVLAPSPGKPTGFVGLEELTASSSATPKASGTPGMSGGTRAALLGSYSGRLKPEDVTVEEIYQFYIKCTSDENRLQVLDLLYNVLTIGQSIIFMQHVKSAKWLAQEMEKLGHKVSLLHGQDMEAKQRLKVMQAFRDGESNVLITTNVLARGIDVLSVTMVVNYDLPMTRDGEADVETYIHRIGRTGRMGNKGIAVSFVHDQHALKIWNDINKDPSMEKAVVTELKNDAAEMCETLEKLQQKLQEENRRRM